MEMANSKIEVGGSVPVTATKLEFDRVPGLSKAPVKFELHELNHQQYWKTALIGVLYGTPIATKGIMLACKTRWQYLSGLFTISAMGF